MHPSNPETRKTQNSLLLLERHERPMRMLKACLERMGYRVLTSSSAEWTQEMLEDPAIDLLIASISKDEEDTHLELLESVLGNRPLLLIETEAAEGAGEGPTVMGCSSVHFLKRPFTLDELDRRIKDALLRRAM